MTTGLTAAVVGTGFIGPVHVEGLQRAGVHVAGIAGSSPAKAEAAAKNLGIPRAYESLQQILVDDSIDVVHLATPNRLHYDQTVAVLEAGKHVLCEKPLAMNSGQSLRLVELARERQRAAAVAYNIRFYPLCHEAAARVQADDFGNLLHVHGSYIQDWLLETTDFNWRVLSKEGGALRAVADIGTHWMDLIQFITGQQIVAVCADLQTVHSERRRPVGNVDSFAGANAASASTQPVAINTEDAGSILLRFRNGGRGSLTVSQTTAGRKNCLQYEIAGGRQALAWNSEAPNSLWIGNRHQANQLLTRDPALLQPRAAAVSSYPGGHNEGFPDTFKQLFRTFYDYIARGDPAAATDFPTFEDGHREILLCEAILRSHQQRHWVEVTG